MIRARPTGTTSGGLSGRSRPRSGSNSRLISSRPTAESSRHFRTWLHGRAIRTYRAPSPSPSIPPTILARYARPSAPSDRRAQQKVSHRLQGYGAREQTSSQTIREEDMASIFLHGGGDHPESRMSTFGRFVQAATGRPGPLALVVVEATDADRTASFLSYSAIFQAVGVAADQLIPLFASATQ